MFLQLLDGVCCSLCSCSRRLISVAAQIKECEVVSVNVKEKTKARPTALNTVELMRQASSGLGMGPHHAMVIAERLYTQVGATLVQW